MMGKTTESSGLDVDGPRSRRYWSGSTPTRCNPAVKSVRSALGSKPSGKCRLKDHLDTDASLDVIAERLKHYSFVPLEVPTLMRGLTV